MNLHQQVQNDIKLKCPLLFYRKISKNNSAIIDNEAGQDMKNSAN